MARINNGPGRHGGFRGGRKPKNASKTLKRLFSYVSNGYKFNMAVVVVCVLLSSITGVISSMFIKNLVDDYIEPMVEGTVTSFAPLAGALAVMAGVMIAGAFCSWLYNFIMVGVAQGVQRDIRNEMFSHMQTLPIKYFDTHTTGDIMSHYTNDTDTLREMLSRSLTQTISSVITMAAVFLAMVYYSWQLTLVVMVFVLVILLITKKFGAMSAKYFVHQQKSLGAVNGYIEEMINGQKVVKVFCHEEEAKEKFDSLNEQLCGDAANANKYANVLMPILNNLGHIQYAVLAIVGGVMAIYGKGNISVGLIISFLTLSKSFTQPIGQLSQQINSIVMALAGAERIFELIDEPGEKDDGYVTLVNAAYDKDGNITESKKRTGKWAWRHPHKSDGSVTYKPLLGDVELSDVDFGYTDEKIVLHNVSIYAKPGQKVAFVGATGAGKTTITNLLNRFYDIADGKIRYDGININKIKKADLRRSLGIVLQDVNLFTGTVMENIRYGKTDATDDEVIAAAKLAGAHDFIMMLPNGYDTVLSGDGSGLSQGQRQLLSIARAAVADPPVMILDEATSSIDTRTEAIVQKGMDSLMKGRTVFVIAHRLSTIQNSDVIMVLENGRIIERGNHEQLLAEKGQYYQLYTGAFELE